MENEKKMEEIRLERKKKQLVEIAERKKHMAEVERQKSEIEIPPGIEKDIYIHYLSFLGPQWADYMVTNETVLKEFTKYFKDTKYRVIWYWDIDGDDLNEYLAVEEYTKIRRGIKRGIVVDEAGRIEIIIDTEKGIYMPRYDYIVLNLKKLGHYKGEVECFAIGYIPYIMKYNPVTGEGKKFSFTIGEPKDYMDYIKENDKRLGIQGQEHGIGSFFLQRIDKDLKVMATEYDDVNASYRGTDFMCLTYLSDLDDVKYEMVRGPFSSTEEYARKRKFLERYRIAKKQGKAFGPPETLNPAHVEKALKIMMLE